MVYAERMHKALVGRTGDWLERTSIPRLTMIAAFGVALLAAWGCSAGLLAVGIRGMALRFPLCFLAGYLTYLLILGAWFLGKPAVDSNALLEGAPSEIETFDPWDDDEEDQLREEVLEQLQDAAENEVEDRGLGAAASVLLLVAIAGILLVAWHWVRHARWYLGKLLVLGGKVRHRSVSVPASGAWLLLPFQQTVWPAVALVVHYWLIGLLLQILFPASTTIADVIRLMR